MRNGCSDNGVEQSSWSNTPKEPVSLVPEVAAGTNALFCQMDIAMLVRLILATKYIEMPWLGDLLLRAPAIFRDAVNSMYWLSPVLDRGVVTLTVASLHTLWPLPIAVWHTSKSTPHVCVAAVGVLEGTLEGTLEGRLEGTEGFTKVYK